MANKAYLTTDPFPSIPPALLNSADIEDYARVTGLIDPFIRDKLKPASYEADFLGELYYWKDDETEPTIEKIEKGKKLTIRKNSIVFIYLDTKFCLPNYIALRFNLRITLVHRGLLLGTGPLIDPGFCGRLLIPLHNLTSEDLVLVGGDGFIWIEFTKVSGNNVWGFVDENRSNDKETRYGTYSEFPPRKIDLRPEQYLAKASPHAPIASSIPHLLDQAGGLYQRASDLFTQLRFYWSLGGALAILTLALTFGTMLYQVFGLVSDSNTYINSLRKDMDVTERKLDQHYKLQQESAERMAQLEREVQKLKAAPEDSRAKKKPTKPGSAASARQ